MKYSIKTEQFIGVLNRIGSEFLTLPKDQVITNLESTYRSGQGSLIIIDTVDAKLGWQEEKDEQ